MTERLKGKLLERQKLVDIIAGPDAYRDLPRLLVDSQEGQAQVCLGRYYSRRTLTFVAPLLLLYLLHARLYICSFQCRGGCFPYRVQHCFSTSPSLAMCFGWLGHCRSLSRKSELNLRTVHHSPCHRPTLFLLLPTCTLNHKPDPNTPAHLSLVGPSSITRSMLCCRRTRRTQRLHPCA